MWEEVSEHQKKIAINRHTIKNFIANNSYAQHEQPAYTINVCWTKFVQYNEIGIEIDKSLLKRRKKNSPAKCSLQLQKTTIKIIAL